MRIFGIGKKKEEKAPACSCQCAGLAPETDVPPVEREGVGPAGDGLSIKVLGTGCASCHALLENTKKAVETMGLGAEVEYVTDMTRIAGYGVMRVPALVVNEKVVSAGKVLKPQEIVTILTHKPEIVCEGKPKVAFICVHNSCRSQIAEALGKKLAGDVFESYSAGTQRKDHINPDAVRIMKGLYGIDMEKTQYSKLISEIPQPDVVIFMGCNVSCPNLPSQYAENWGLDDPSGKEDAAFIHTIAQIEKKILALKEKL